MDSRDSALWEALPIDNWPHVTTQGPLDPIWQSSYIKDNVNVLLTFHVNLFVPIILLILILIYIIQIKNSVSIYSLIFLFDLFLKYINMFGQKQKQT